MQPTEPTPSTDVRQPDAQAPAAEPSASEEQPASPPSWWQRLFHREQEPGPEAEEVSSQPGASSARTMTEEEFQRSVQAEVDRREYKRKQETEAAEERKLRDDDPFAYADKQRRAEAAAKQHAEMQDVLQRIARTHDAVTLDPLMQRLPAQEQQRILAIEASGDGLAARKMLTDEALTSLEKHWRAEGAKDAEARLRKSQIFRKQLSAEFHGSEPEPEVLPSGGVSSNGKSISDILRAQLGRR